MWIVVFLREQNSHLLAFISFCSLSVLSLSGLMVSYSENFISLQIMYLHQYHSNPEPQFLSFSLA